MVETTEKQYIDCWALLLKEDKVLHYNEYRLQWLWGNKKLLNDSIYSRCFNKSTLRNPNTDIFPKIAFSVLICNEFSCYEALPTEGPCWHLYNGNMTYVCGSHKQVIQVIPKEWQWNFSNTLSLILHILHSPQWDYYGNDF